MAGLAEGLLPYRAPAMDNPFVMPGDQQRERLSTAFGWDVGRPWQELGRRAMTMLPLAPFGAGRSSVGARIVNDHIWASQTPSGIMYPGLGASLARRYPSAFRDRARAPSAEPPQLPPSNNNRPFLRRGDHVANPYDFAAAWQQAMRQRLGKD